MTIDQAFEHLLNKWKEQKKDFRDKYRSYRSKFQSGKFKEVGHRKMREILLEAGYKENWEAPKK
jgi:hypothetical protein